MIIIGFKERTPETMRHESKSSPHSHQGISNTTKRRQRESKRTRN